MFADADGQFVLGDDGEKVRGVWLLTDQEDVVDVPLMVYASSSVNRGDRSSRGSIHRERLLLCRGRTSEGKI